MTCVAGFLELYESEPDGRVEPGADKEPLFANQGCKKSLVNIDELQGGVSGTLKRE